MQTKNHLAILAAFRNAAASIVGAKASTVLEVSITSGGILFLGERESMCPLPKFGSAEAAIILAMVGQSSGSTDSKGLSDMVDRHASTILELRAQVNNLKTTAVEANQNLARELAQARAENESLQRTVDKLRSRVDAERDPLPQDHSKPVAVRMTFEVGQQGKALKAAGLTVDDVRALLAQRDGAEVLSEQNLMCARNEDLCQLDEPVVDGDEVAFFPPVTGG